MSNDQDETLGPQRQVSDVSLHEIGAQLSTLGQQLMEIGKHTDNRELRKYINDVHEYGDDEHVEELRIKLAGAIRQTLTGLNGFRREYANWERLTVEYALTQSGLTQRDVARLLGVGLSTVNRWAQHPLTYED
jgi:hypothetical protein